MACDATDVIAAVAPVDFDCATNLADIPSCVMCEPVRPISQVHFRDTADNLVPYAGDARRWHDPPRRRRTNLCGMG
ncbi:MAG: hypothetical protein OXU20_39935 [Myxococcales bacterium]|nr:hypothetical protein [Myxococcales bacterium]